MSNNNTTTKKTTFWKFLTDNTIEIPIIQRDYAQGRERKEHLRKNFLFDLKAALDKGEELKLDFVYGSKENNKLNPLDGQQRLTTLWLLHWYIALRSDNLKKANSTLNKFTYETRISSREFCKELCKAEKFQNYCFGNIVEYIKNQTWFYSTWKQDPTIQSMLRMLGGTKNEKGDPNNDGIEQIFNCNGCNIINNEKKCKYDRYWDILTEEQGKNCPIVFYYLPLNEFKLTDDLYIKMNARGEQLTSFENFKADLIGYITKQKDNNNLHEERKEWENLLDKNNGIPIKMDTDWTNIFWENKSQDYKIDDIFFAFLNRFFLNKIICQKKENGEYFYTADSLEKDNPSFSILYGNKGNDSNIQYNDLGLYKYLQGNIPYVFFDSLQNTLNAYYNIKNSILEWKDAFPVWVDSNFEFIPKYIDGKEVSTLGQKERVVFHAVCRYFENDGNKKNVYEETLFKQWLRIVWNIVENSGIETIPAMIGAMRLIDELSEHSHDIYDFLSNPQSQIKSDFAKDQVIEEIAKAQQILDKEGKPRQYEGIHKKENGSIYHTWEDIIKGAENTAFFNGTIRFLFQEENRKIDKDPESETWNTNNFDIKLENAKKYFDENGVKDCVDEKYRTDAILLKSVLYHVKDFWEYIEPQKFVLDNTASTWKKNILLEHGWENAVHEILMGNLTVTERNEDCVIYKTLYKTDLLNYVANEQVGSRIRWHHGHRTVYPPRYDGIMLDDEKRDKPFYRNRILSSLSKITSKQRIKGKSFFKGWDINFNYSKEGNLYDFQWNTDGNVYLIENNERKTSFPVEGIDDVAAFEEGLIRLIEKYTEQ